MAEDFFGVSYATPTAAPAPTSFIFAPPTEPTGDLETDDFAFSSTTGGSSLSDTQEKWLSALTVVSGCLSLAGSSIIIYRVRHTQEKKPYDRLLFGLSCCDLVASWAFILQPFLLPRNTSDRVWAIGNDATCVFLGFLYQLAFAAMWYTGMLNYYYLLTVRYGIKRDVFTQKYEKWMHIGTLGYFSVTAVVGASIPGLFSEFDTGMGCWIGQYPAGCEDRGETCIGDYIGWLFGGIPILIVFFSLIVNNIIIFRHVRRIMTAKSVSGSGGDNSIVNKNSMDHPTSMEGSTHSEDDKKVAVVGNLSKKPSFQSNSSNSQSSSKGGGGEDELSASMRSNTSIKSTTTRSHSSASTQKKHIREVATQGFLYVACFFITYTPGFAVRVLGSFGFDGSMEDSIFWLLVLNALLFPLQGFFNCIVFTRPNYIRLKAYYTNPDIMSADEIGDITTWWMLRQALVGHDIPTLAESSINITSRRTPTRGGQSRATKSHDFARSSVYQSGLEPLREAEDEDMSVAHSVRTLDTLNLGGDKNDDGEENLMTVEEEDKEAGPTNRMEEGEEGGKFWKQQPIGNGSNATHSTKDVTTKNFDDEYDSNSGGSPDAAEKDTEFDIESEWAELKEQYEELKTDDGGGSESNEISFWKKAPFVSKTSSRSRVSMDGSIRSTG